VSFSWVISSRFLSGCGRGDEGEGFCDVFEWFVFGVDAEDDFDEAADDHDDCGEEVLVEQQGGVAAVADECSVDDGSEGAEGLRDGEEHGDGHGPDFEGEDFADGEVGSARAGGGEEEDHAPGDGLGDRGEQAGVEQPGADREQHTPERM